MTTHRLRVAHLALASSLFSLFVVRVAHAEEPATTEATEEPAPPPLPPPEPTSTTTTTSAVGPRDTAQAEPKPQQEEDETVDTRGIKVGQLDVRGAMNSDVMLAYMGLGMSVDLGAVPVGPGTIAIGGGFEYDFCGSVCWGLSAATPLELSQRQIWPQARASYHLGLRSAKSVDLYPFVGVGPVFARSEVNVASGAAQYVGTDTAIGINMGLGASYFIGKGPFFVGGEARLRYAGGDYGYRLSAGDGNRAYDSTAVSQWSLTGVDVLVALGVRIQ